MTEGIFTVRVDPEKQHRIDTLAQATDRSRNYVVNQAIDHFLELQSWQIARIEEGIEAAERGAFATDEQVRRIVNKHKS